ncbi:MAG TPA: hypothetical protein VFV72_08560 [Candidatus Limnocylindrales bacterium]|nr:hypothetical protein [Candidatus Limnocylindrales bacterium]
MSTSQAPLNEALLRDVLRVRAEGDRSTGELIDDVLFVVGSSSQTRGWQPRPVTISQSILVASAAMLLLLGALIGSLLVGAQVRRETQPIPTAVPAHVPVQPILRPFVGLPPVDAEPSTPETGELVKSSSGIHPWYSANVYADGRIIWSGDSDTGWVEQRLSPEGVDLVRSGAASLDGQYVAPLATLPDSAWLDRTVRAYVPARFSACYWFLDDYDADPADALDAFPENAKELFANALRTYYIRSDGEGTPGDVHCHDLSTKDARRLAAILPVAGALVLGENFNSSDFAIVGLDQIGEATVSEDYTIPKGTPYLYVSPLLPHGESIGAGLGG